mmetsp:Transcript_8008/g.19250  ORF Transcript_8008/g.19250 Transcript_8008/m.19250 type:complete len:503 (-) Transcript_8008:491-1999(-)
MSNFRPDRVILKRQKDEARYEHLVDGNLDQVRVEQKAHWENKTGETIRGIRVKNKVKELLATQRDAAIHERRKKLSALYYAEKAQYEAELAELTRPDPAKGMKKMKDRAAELKDRREQERTQLVKEKLYQQWREGIDELRTQDAKLFELQVTFERGIQKEEKAEADAQEARESAIYDALWQEGYHAKVEREIREKEMRAGLTAKMARTLAEQIHLKEKSELEEAEILELERAEMREQWANAEREAAELVERNAAVAKEERKKVDEFKRVCEEEAAKQEAQDKLMDKQFVLSVLKKEKAIAEKEEADKALQKKKVLEFNEKLKMDMNRKAASDAELVRLQNEEQERQWQKKFDQWEKEELARRRLLEDVYEGRMEQINLKNEVRDRQKQDILSERARVEAEIERLEGIDQERARAEAILKKRHQEELFRQMDFHQVQRHRELQQHMIEQRQALIAEERFRQAKEAEAGKQAAVKEQIKAHQEAAVKKRNAEKEANARKAPWEK